MLIILVCVGESGSSTLGCGTLIQHKLHSRGEGNDTNDSGGNSARLTTRNEGGRTGPKTGLENGLMNNGGKKTADGTFSDGNNVRGGQGSQNQLGMLLCCHGYRHHRY